MTKAGKIEKGREKVEGDVRCEREKEEGKGRGKMRGKSEKREEEERRKSRREREKGKGKGRGKREKGEWRREMEMESEKGEWRERGGRGRKERDKERGRRESVEHTEPKPFCGNITVKGFFPSKEPEKSIPYSRETAPVMIFCLGRYITVLYNHSGFCSRQLIHM